MTPITDAQVHTYDRDHPARPWNREEWPSWAKGRSTHGPDEVTGATMVNAMDEAGVDAAVLVSPWVLYRYDPSYAFEVARAYPARFRVVAPLDPFASLARESMVQLAEEPTLVGLRLVIADHAVLEAAIRDLDWLFVAAAEHGLPVAMLGRDLPAIGRIAHRHPNTRFLVDHLGMSRPGEPPRWPELLDLALRDNVSVKLTAVPTLSRQAFPFLDLWPHLDAVLAAFGLARCAWGTDWTSTLDRLSYREGVDYIRETDRLSSTDKAQLMGGTIRRIYGWR